MTTAAAATGTVIRKVAIVEDDPTMALLLEETCRMAGWTAIGTATTMGGGLDILDFHRPECLILDFRLEGTETGLDLIAAARKQQPDLFTILITAWDINDLATMIGPDKPDRILRKPVMAKTLAEILTTIAPRPRKT